MQQTVCFLSYLVLKLMTCTLTPHNRGYITACMAAYMMAHMVPRMRDEVSCTAHTHQQLGFLGVPQVYLPIQGSGGQQLAIGAVGQGQHIMAMLQGLHTPLPTAYMQHGVSAELHG